MNYKTKRPSIVVGGLEITVPATATVKILHDQNGGATAADSLWDLSDNAVYVVATGKVFHLCGMKLWTKATVAGGEYVAWSTGDTEDAETGAIINIQMPLNNADTGEYQLGFPPDMFTWQSGKYVVLKPSAARLDHIVVIGYEI